MTSSTPAELRRRPIKRTSVQIHAAFALNWPQGNESALRSSQIDVATAPSPPASLRSPLRICLGPAWTTLERRANGDLLRRVRCRPINLNVRRRRVDDRYPPRAILSANNCRTGTAMIA